MSEPELEFIIETPSQVTCMDVEGTTIVVGCEDGTLRRYVLPDVKVTKAVMGLGGSVSWAKLSDVGTEKEHVWISSGMNLFKFTLSVSTSEVSTIHSILRPKDAIATINVPSETEDDEINELALGKEMLAFTMDSGQIGVLDLSTHAVTFMRQAHGNIALPISFIPGRLTEMCSGGYDNALLHFDARTGSMLSHLTLDPPTLENDDNQGISLSPPFALGIDISPGGIIACSTASGHVWLGFGGSKRAKAKQGKRKSRKWDGLKSTEGVWQKVANGPIVAISFPLQDDSSLYTLSMHGILSCWTMPKDYDEEISNQPRWTIGSKRLLKTVTLKSAQDRILTCGIATGQKGIVECWKFAILSTS
ncbi:hypothetical protein CPB86DRAFT_704384 [Serendipita vermifera]|nr:hypothetical protein CPB86DRAFT_704384 [Serendipita vermifera]